MSTFHLTYHAFRANTDDRCRNTHDIAAYIAAKPRDIRFPTADAISDSPPFVSSTQEDVPMPENESTSIDPTVKCPVFETLGECKHGLKCRFLGGHVHKTDDGEYHLTVDEEKMARAALSETEVNFVGQDTLKLVRSKKVWTHRISNTNDTKH